MQYKPSLSVICALQFTVDRIYLRQNPGRVCNNEKRRFHAGATGVLWDFSQGTVSYIAGTKHIFLSESSTYPKTKRHGLFQKQLEKTEIRTNYTVPGGKILSSLYARMLMRILKDVGGK